MMMNSTFFENMTKAWGLGPQGFGHEGFHAPGFGPPPAAAWPPSPFHGMFECPMAVGTHFQQFLTRRLQHQAEFLHELSRERNPQDIFAKHMAYLQQAAMAWSTEMIQMSEIAQSKLMGAATDAAGPAGEDAPPNHPYRRAA